MRLFPRCLSLLIPLFAIGYVRADIISFDDLTDSTVVTTQYTGLTFSNAIILTAGVSLNEFEFPPYSGMNVVSDDGGPITILFTTPVTSVSGYFTYLVPLTMTAFDSGNNPIGTALSTYSANLALSGDLGSSPNELLTLSFTGGIGSVTITGDPTGGSFTLDDLTYRSATTVPEPAPLVLLSTCVVILFAARKQYRI